MGCNVNWTRCWQSFATSLGLLALSVSTVQAEPKNIVNTEAPVSARCVSADGLTFESCGGAGGGGTQYNQGTVTTDTDILTMAGCVRADTAAIPTGVLDGDRVRCIVDSTGRLWTFAAQSGTWTVTQSGAWTVTANAGTGNFTVVQPTGTNLHVVCDSGCTPGGSTADNSVFTFGTTALNPAGYVFDDTAPNAVTENNVATPRMSANRVPYGTLRDAAGNERGANVNASNELQVAANAGTNLNTSALLTTAAHDAALGTAGTADTQVRTVQGIAGMTKLLVTPDSVALPANQSVNVAQYNGAGAQEASSGKNTTGAGLPATATVGQCDDTAPAALTENQFGHARINCTTHHQLVEVGAALPAGTNNIGDVDVVTLPSVTIGTFPDNEPFNVAQINGVTPLMGNGITGTGSQRVTIASDNTAFTVNVGTFPDNEPINLAQIAGTAPNAHDAVISSDSVPLTISGYAESPEDSDANTNGNRSSADADKQRLLVTRYGEMFVREGGVFKWTYHENSSAALTDTTIHASCGAGLFNYITHIAFSTNAATAASVMIEDSTTTAILGPYYLEAVAGRGLAMSFPGGKKQTTAATLIAVTTTGAIAHGLDIQGFCAP